MIIIHGTQNFFIRITPYGVYGAGVKNTPRFLPETQKSQEFQLGSDVTMLLALQGSQSK